MDQECRCRKRHRHRPTIQTQVKTMNKFKMSQIRNKSGVYYAVGIAVFSAFFFVMVVIAELVNRNS